MLIVTSALLDEGRSVCEESTQLQCWRVLLFKVTGDRPAISVKWNLNVQLFTYKHIFQRSLGEPTVEKYWNE